MRLTQYLEPDLVVVDLEADGVDDAIGTLVDRLHETGKIDDPAAIRRAVLDREASHTTALGNGVALPHATVPGIDRAHVVVAVAPDGVPFGPDADGERPERLFFMLLSPIDEAATHIKLLARIVRLVRRRDFVDALLEAGSAADIIDEIEREDALHV
jgi:mannitol/fructose-specific phosphotransferase system IIA component (Ntr-type)